MEIDSQTGLVLEGGGMRAIFTVGVLDYFMDHDIWFPFIRSEYRRVRVTVSRMLPASGDALVLVISTY